MDTQYAASHPWNANAYRASPKFSTASPSNIKDTSWSIAYKNRFVYIGTSTRPQIQSAPETLPAHETFSETIKSLPAHETFSETIKSLPAYETPTPETLPDPAQNNSNTPQTLSSSQSDRAPYYDVRIIYGGAILKLYRDEKMLLLYNALKRHGKSPPVSHGDTACDTKDEVKPPHTDYIIPCSIISPDITLRNTVMHLDTIRRYLHRTSVPLVQGTAVVQTRTTTKKPAKKSETNALPGKEQFNNAVNGMIDFIRHTTGLTDFSLHIDLTAGYTADQPDGARYKQIGNAVCIPVIEPDGETRLCQVTRRYIGWAPLLQTYL